MGEKTPSVGLWVPALAFAVGCEAVTMRAAILFTLVCFQPVAVDRFHLSLCKSLYRIRPFTSF